MLQRSAEKERSPRVTCLLPLLKERLGARNAPKGLQGALKRECLCCGFPWDDVAKLVEGRNSPSPVFSFHNHLPKDGCYSLFRRPGGLQHGLKPAKPSYL